VVPAQSTTSRTVVLSGAVALVARVVLILVDVGPNNCATIAGNIRRMVIGVIVRLAPRVVALVVVVAIVSTPTVVSSCRCYHHPKRQSSRCCPRTQDI